MATFNESGEMFDIIIVGAGTAGCVLANRLSEDPDISVLLLEAGEDRNQDERVYIPGLSHQLIGNNDFDWQYVSVPQPGIDHRTMKHPRGKVIGGSSAINSFALIWPSAEGMNAWADLGNGEEWGWEKMKPYFRKFRTLSAPSEQLRSEIDIIDDDDPVGSDNGPIQASYPLTVSPLHKAWVETFKSLGLPHHKDPLDGVVRGGGITECHISGERRERSHAGVAYLEPVRERGNLTVITGAHAQRIVFDGTTSEEGKALRQATGVIYSKGDRFCQVRARKEIILAAGVFGTPQLLELSGIGDADLLTKYGIEMVYHNPHVGTNLQDHIRSGIWFDVADGVDPPGPLPMEEARKLYDMNRSGPLAQRACHTFAYLPLDPFIDVSEREELDHIVDKCLDNESLTEFERKRNKFIREQIFSPTEATSIAYLSRKNPFAQPQHNDCITLFAFLSYPLSRGTVHIASPDAAVKPNIDFKYYSHPLDLEIHARHLQILEKIVATSSPLKEFMKKDGMRMPLNTEGPMIHEKIATTASSLGVLPKKDTAGRSPSSEGPVVLENIAATASSLGRLPEKDTAGRSLSSEGPMVLENIAATASSLGGLPEKDTAGRSLSSEGPMVLGKIAATDSPLGEMLEKDRARRSLSSAGSMTLDAAKDVVRRYPLTNYHPCGTCGMMPEHIGGVVDAGLKVYGTANVRVVDASIMPIIPRGNIITTVYAVAEKAADVVSRDLWMKRAASAASC